MTADILFDYWDAQATGRKSIPKAVIERDGFEIYDQKEYSVPFLILVTTVI